LLDAGADPDRLNSKGKTFLHQAVFRGSPAVVELLLARFPETSGEKIDLSMLIRKAILRSEKKIAMMLIEYCGAAGKTQEINTPDASGITPLMLAAKIKDVRLITALLDAGADPAARSNSGRNVLHKISKEISPNQKNSIVLNKNLLNTESENFLHQKINFSQIENLVKKFIARGVSVNDADSAGNTPALIAAREKNIPLVKLLLSQGANINAKNKDGYTLLHYALQNKDTNLSSFLVENGATFDTEDSAL
jgi:serine/threonine-protein phosphatase 6 regulatory ankyrin repeat subunit B